MLKRCKKVKDNRIQSKRMSNCVWMSAAASRACICNDLRVCMCIVCIYGCVWLLLSFLVTCSSRHRCYVILAVKHIHTHLCSCRHTRTVYTLAQTSSFFFFFRPSERQTGYPQIMVRELCMVAQHNQENPVSSLQVNNWLVYLTDRVWGVLCTHHHLY